MKWAGHVTRLGKRSIYDFGANPEGKKPLGRPGRRWTNNIKMDRMGLYGLD
jgi:hypothetical protein